jgi:hypothetical protein
MFVDSVQHYTISDFAEESSTFCNFFVFVDSCSCSRDEFSYGLLLFCLIMENPYIFVCKTFWMDLICCSDSFICDVRILKLYLNFIFG